MELTSLRTLVCPSCGAPIHHGDLNCEYCGAAVYAGQAAEVITPALAQAQNLIPEMRRRIEENPLDGDAYYQLGLALFTIKLYDQAEEAFAQALRLSLGSALVHYFAGLAMLYRSEDEILSIEEFRLNEMRKQFQLAAKLDPSIAVAGVYGQFMDALLERNHGDYAGAVDPLKAVIEQLPKFGLAWQVLAACQFQTADYPAAIAAARQALELSPWNADLAYLIGAAYGRLDNLDEMEAWAHRVAQIRGHPDAWEQVLTEFKGKIE